MEKRGGERGEEGSNRGMEREEGEGYGRTKEREKEVYKSPYSVIAKIQPLCSPGKVCDQWSWNSLHILTNMRYLQHHREGVYTFSVN